MDRFMYPPARSHSRSPAVEVHRAHLSHYISQLTALEREQQRLALEQQLLARQQRQLAAKRDQLTYLIAEEQDLVLRAIQQQREQRHAQEEAAIAAALAERESQIARRQRLRYAVYRKQQEEQAQKDSQIQKVLKFVQNQAQLQQQEEQDNQSSSSPFNAFEQIQRFRQQTELARPQAELTESEETDLRPGTVSQFLRQQGIKPREFFPPYKTQEVARKRGSRRGNSVSSNSTDAPQSSKLVPDVNYASAQDFLSALFGGPENAQAEAEELGPKKTIPAEQTPESASKKLSLEDLATILFGEPEEQPSVSPSVPKIDTEKENAGKSEVPTRPAFQYTLSSSRVPVTPKPAPSAFDIIAKQIDELKDKVEHSAAKIEEVQSNESLDESQRRHLLLQIQVDLERYYSDLDDIITSPPDEVEESDEDKEKRLQLRLRKHSVTATAVDAADRIDKILTPVTPSESDDTDYEVISNGQDERNPEEPSFMLEEPVSTIVDGSGASISESQPINKEAESSSSSSSSESTSVFASEMPSPKAEASRSEPGEKVLENDEYFVVENPVLETATVEPDETLDEEEKSEVKISLTPTPVASATASSADLAQSDDAAQDPESSSVILTSDSPVEHDERAEEVFLPESGDKAGKVTLETNTGEEKEEFLENEEVNEEKVPLTSAKKLSAENSERGTRSESPVRHIVIEDVPDDE